MFISSSECKKDSKDEDEQNEPLKVDIRGKKLFNILDKNSMATNNLYAHFKRQCGEQEEDSQNLTSAK